MSKCYANWMRLPNSRRDRQERPKQFFRQKGRVEDPERLDEKSWKKMEKEKESRNE